MVNKKIFLSLLTICFISVVAAGTWADYTAEAEVSTTAAASDFGLTAGSFATWEMDGATATTWAPGQTVTSEITVTNDGDLPGYLFADLIAPATTEGAEDIALAGLIQATLEDADGNGVTTLSDVDSGLTEINLGEVPAGTTKTLTLSLFIPHEADISIAGGSISPTINFKLNQNDNYGNTFQ